MNGETSGSDGDDMQPPAWAKCIESQVIESVKSLLEEHAKEQARHRQELRDAIVSDFYERTEKIVESVEKKHQDFIDKHMPIRCESCRQAQAQHTHRTPEPGSL